MSEFEKMIAGQYYNPADPELRALVASSRAYQKAFNEQEDRQLGVEILKEWFGSTGEQLSVKPRFVCDYGVNIYLGGLC